MNPKAEACGYILIMLLQRLEKSQPGLLNDMIAGVDGDQSAIASNVPNRDHISAVFNEALTILRQANNAKTANH